MNYDTWKTTDMDTERAYALGDICRDICRDIEADLDAVLAVTAEECSTVIEPCLADLDDEHLAVEVAVRVRAIVEQGRPRLNAIAVASQLMLLADSVLENAGAK